MRRAAVRRSVDITLELEPDELGELGASDGTPFRATRVVFMWTYDTRALVKTWRLVGVSAQGPRVLRGGKLSTAMRGTGTQPRLVWATGGPDGVEQLPSWLYALSLANRPAVPTDLPPDQTHRDIRKLIAP